MYNSDQSQNAPKGEGKNLYEIDEKDLQPGVMARVVSGLMGAGVVVLIKNLLFDSKPVLASDVESQSQFLSSETTTLAQQKIGRSLRLPASPDGQPEVLDDQLVGQRAPGPLVEAPQFRATNLFQEALPGEAHDGAVASPVQNNGSPQTTTRDNVVRLDDFVKSQSAAQSPASLQGKGGGGAVLRGEDSADAFDPDLFDAAFSDDDEGTSEYDVGDNVDTDPDSDTAGDDADQEPGSNRAPIQWGAANLGNLLVNQVFLITISSLLANTVDPDGDPLNVVNLSASSGTLLPDGAHSWIFQPDFQDVGTVTFSYGVTDGQAITPHTAQLGVIAGFGRAVGGTSATGRQVEKSSGDVVVSHGRDHSNVALTGDYSIGSGPGLDRIMGSDGDDLIIAGGGDDEVWGLGGNDTIFGGAGDDSIFGGVGADQILGESGNDYMTAGAGSDIVRGGSGDDTIYATYLDGDDHYDGESGSDTYDFSMSSADTRIDLAAGTASSSTTGSDSIYGIENIIGGSGNDVIIARVHFGDIAFGSSAHGSSADPVFVSAAAADAAAGAGAAASAAAAAAPSASAAPSAGDQVETLVLAGGEAPDNRNDGSELILAGSAALSTRDQTGTLVLAGTDGGIAEGGDDLNLAGAAAPLTADQVETLVLAGTDGRINEGNGDDFNLAGSAAPFVAEQLDSVILTGSDDRVYGSDGNDLILAGSEAALADDGNADPAELERVSAGDGDDRIFVDAEQISGGDGNDQIVTQTSTTSFDAKDYENQISGGDGNDHITAGVGDDEVSGGDGDDVIVATYMDGDDEYDGGHGNDTYDFSAISADTEIDLGAGTAYSAATGDDQISNFENVIAGAGNDTIVANQQANILTGGAGNDTFIFSQAESLENDGSQSRDLITDFEVGDRIDISQIDADANSSHNQLFVLLSDQPDGMQAGHILYYHEMFEDQERTYIDFFVNDDDEADFGLELLGHHELTSDDFVGVL